MATSSCPRFFRLRIAHYKAETAIKACLSKTAGENQQREMGASGAELESGDVVDTPKGLAGKSGQASKAGIGETPAHPVRDLMH